jgi:hypothetical protein
MSTRKVIDEVVDNNASGNITKRLLKNIDNVPNTGPNRVKIGKFLKGEDVGEAGAHAKEVGKVTGIVDRGGTKVRRAQRMKGRPKVPGKDLDEFPPAVIKPDDPLKVSVKPINRTHNRRSGGRLRHELPPDGTPVEIDPWID